MSLAGVFASAMFGGFAGAVVGFPRSFGPPAPAASFVDKLYTLRYSTKLAALARTAVFFVESPLLKLKGIPRYCKA